MSDVSSSTNPLNSPVRQDGKSADPRKAGKTAILVIHGIGEQNPYETLDSFASGLALYFKNKDKNNPPRLHPERIRHEDWTQAAVHLEFGKNATPNGLRLLSLFEFYWAPFTEGKMTYRAVLGWLARTSLTPLRYLSDNLQLMIAADKRNPGGRVPKSSVASLFFQEVLRIFLVYLPILIASIALTFFLSSTPSALKGIFLEFRKLFTDEEHKLALIVSAMCAVVAVVMACFIVRELWSWLRRLGNSVERTAENTWVVAAILSMIGFAAVAWLIAQWAHFNAAPYLNVLFRTSTLSPVFAFLIILLLRRVLVDYVGDIAVYCTADAKSANFHVRSAILDSSTRALANILMDATANYDQVILAGHSLGSVIAYDTINEMLSKAWAVPSPIGKAPDPPLQPAQLDKLKGLVTFGSPLDKIYYFFREHVTSSQAVRSQILSFLHSFRRKRSGRQYGDLTLDYSRPSALPGASSVPFEFPHLSDDFLWLNAWAPLDPVSDRLQFYEVDDTLTRPYLIWGLAHLRYWSDLKFYEFFASRLL